MTTYTTAQLESGEGLSSERSMIAASYDGGQTWITCELSEGIGGDPTDVVTVPPRGWDYRA